MAMSNCLIVQHAAPESAFAIGDALARAQINPDVRRVFAGDALPDGASDLDGLVVMGGPMSAASDTGFPTRAAELALLADALRIGVPTLGVCLGAQLLASATGASVFRGPAGPEIGWGPVSLSSECDEDPLFAGLPETLTVLHWHGETFELPVGARRLIGNANYSNQAFRIGESAWGLQFHLEVTALAVEGFLAEFADDTAGIPGGGQRIADASPAALAELARSRDLVLDRFAGLVSARVARGDLVDLG